MSNIWTCFLIIPKFDIFSKAEKYRFISDIHIYPLLLLINGFAVRVMHKNGHTLAITHNWSLLGANIDHWLRPTFRGYLAQI